MKKGDLVTVDDYLQYVGGKHGIVLEVQSGKHCIGVYVLFADVGVKLVSIENLKVTNESR